MDKAADKTTAAPRGTAEASSASFTLDPDNRSTVSDRCRLFTAAHATRRIILTGTVQSGKSTLAALLVKRLADKGIPAAGILARGLWENNRRAGFDLIDLKTGLSTPLARRSAAMDGPGRRAMPFRFLETGVAAGRRALSVAQCSRAGLILVDEIGKLEARGLGWAPNLAPLLGLSGARHLWIVREHLVERICRIWHVALTRVIPVTAPDALERLTDACVTGNRI